MSDASNSLDNKPLAFIMITTEEDNTTFDAETLRYKKLFEEHWSRLNIPLREVFFNRKLTLNDNEE